MFSNVHCIMDKLESDGKIQSTYNFFQEILKGEISFAIKGFLNRALKTRKIFSNFRFL